MTLNPDDESHRPTRLEGIARALRVASEHVETDESLSEDDLRALETMKRTTPDGAPWPLGGRALLVAAAVLVIGVVGALFLLDLPDLEPRASIAIEMQEIGATRSEGDWRPGDRFALEISLHAGLFLHVLHLDADRKLEFLFPYRDEEAGAWTYLGHENNEVSAGGTLSIPAKDFPYDLTIEAPRSARESSYEESFVAFASAGPIADDALLDLLEKLRELVQRGEREGRNGDALVDMIQESIETRYPGLQAKRRITITWLP